MIDKIIAGLMLTLAFTNCQTKAPASVPDDRQLQSVVGAGYDIQKNKTNTFALCTKISDRSSEFKIVRLKDLKVVNQEVLIQGGKVSWIEDLKIKVIKGAEIVRADENPEDYVRIIDLNQYLLNEN